jgi:hypothetical protein
MKILRMSKQAAMKKSADEADLRGCTGVTQYWWDYCDQGVLFYNEDYSGLSEAEINSLIEYVSPQED